jgi:hypothetical protein
MKRQTAVNCTSWGGVWAKETAAVKNGSRSADLMTASKGYLNGTDYISVLDWDLGTAPCGVVLWAFTTYRKTCPVSDRGHCACWTTCST